MLVFSKSKRYFPTKRLCLFEIKQLANSHPKSLISKIISQMIIQIISSEVWLCDDDTININNESFIWYYFQWKFHLILHLTLLSLISTNGVVCNATPETQIWHSISKLLKPGPRRLLQSINFFDLHFISYLSGNPRGTSMNTSCRLPCRKTILTSSWKSGKSWFSEIESRKCWFTRRT